MRHIKTVKGPVVFLADRYGKCEPWLHLCNSLHMCSALVRCIPRPSATKSSTLHEPSRVKLKSGDPRDPACLARLAQTSRRL